MQRNVSLAPAAPAAIGPYSQAVEIGDLIYTSGQIGLDPVSGTLVEGGIHRADRRVIENLSAVLQAAGCGLADVVKTTVFLKDMNDFSAMNEIYGRNLVAEGLYLPHGRP